MPIEKTIKLYRYDELSESAKETAKDWWLECRDETDYESTIDDFVTIAEKLGITFKTHTVRLMGGSDRQDPCIWYSLGYCQSDYAAFDGRYAYAKGGAAAVKEYAPQDAKLAAIADRLTAEQKANGYKLGAVIEYSDYYGLQVEAFKGDDDEWHDPATLKEIFRDLARWLYDRLIEQDEYLRSDEQIEEAMSANEYTFTEDGKRENP